MTTGLTSLPLTQITSLLRAGDISSKDLTQAFIDRIEELDPHLHAFLTLTPENALSQAAKADQCLADWRQSPDQALSPLVGVPLAIKDVLCVADVRCTCGSRILEDFAPPFHATAVQRL
jgi:aspartyl-tRNA(Asn)/glutamyl-tRNA(Gln) amidotransferase subunit A